MNAVRVFAMLVAIIGVTAFAISTLAITIKRMVSQMHAPTQTTTTTVPPDVACRMFAPRDDITAWEVARVVQGAGLGAAGTPGWGIYFTPQQWDALPDHLKLQFKEC